MTELTKQQIEDMRTSLGLGAQPFTKEAIDSLCALAVLGLAVPEAACIPWGWKLVPERLTEDMLNSLRASVRVINLVKPGAAVYEIEARYTGMWSDLLNIAPSVPSPLRQSTGLVDCCEHCGATPGMICRRADTPCMKPREPQPHAAEE